MPSSVVSPSVADSFNAAEVDDELDPVALNKAYNFAAWSSLVLVGTPSVPRSLDVDRSLQLIVLIILILGIRTRGALAIHAIYMVAIHVTR